MKNLLFLALIFCCSYAVSGQIQWESLEGPIGSSSVNSILKDNSGQLHLLTEKQYLVSLDQGLTWQKNQLPPLPSSNDTYELVSHPTELPRLIIHTTGRATLYKQQTILGGFTKIAESLFGKIFKYAENGRLWAVSRQHKFVYSDDDGLNFKDLTLSGNPITGGTPHQLIISHDGTRALYRIGTGVCHDIYRIDLTTGQKAYVSQTCGLGQAVAIHPSLEIMYLITQGSFRYSSDYGVNWVTSSTPLAQYSIINLFMHENDPMYAFGSYDLSNAFDGMLKSTDAGKSWFEIPNIDDGDYEYGAFLHRTGTDLWFDTDPCSVRNFARSGDMGATWTDLRHFLVEAGTRNLQYVEQLGVLAHTCSGVQYFSEADSTWRDIRAITQQGTKTCVQFQMNKNGDGVGITEDGKLFYTPDAGTTWATPTVIDTNVLLQQGTLFVAADGDFYFWNTHAYSIKSEDGGKTWRLLNNWAPFSYQNLQAHPNGDFYSIEGFDSHHYDAALDTIVAFALPPGVITIDVRSFAIQPNGDMYITTDKFPFLYCLVASSQAWVARPITLPQNSFISQLTTDENGHLYWKQSSSHSPQIQAMLIKSTDGGLTTTFLGTIPNVGFISNSDGSTFYYANYEGPVHKSNFVTTHTLEIKQAQMKVYPNPCSDWLQISLDEVQGKTVVCKLYNMLGQMVLEQNLTASKTSIETHNLTPGVYFLHLNNANQMIGSQTIVVQRN